jgi:hypothetical protein
MYKKTMLIGAIIVGTGVIGNEFIKPLPAREKRKEKMQQESVSEECIKLIDGLMSRVTVVQERLSKMTNVFYRVLRSCAAEDTPPITQLSVSELKRLQSSLQVLETQLLLVENTLCSDKSLQGLSHFI